MTREKLLLCLINAVLTGLMLFGLLFAWAYLTGDRSEDAVPHEPMSGETFQKYRELTEALSRPEETTVVTEASLERRLAEPAKSKLVMEPEPSYALTLTLPGYPPGHVPSGVAGDWQITACEKCGEPAAFLIAKISASGGKLWALCPKHAAAFWRLHRPTTQPEGD